MKRLKLIPPEVKRKRKLKKLFKRMFWLTLAALGYFFLVPKIAPSYAPAIDKNREMIIKAARNVQSQTAQIVSLATQIGQEVLGSKAKLDQKGPELLVKETVDDLTERVKALPKEQLGKVKREFCADVIDEATKAGEQGDETKP
ncbi:MAG: hypothetical protein A2900_02675 [Candidatus Chisholmbacteria bacterium RIFCSPLOWO2_01_FULL_50_28]|uniref:Uncharacterized protein n=1 Tax=Candidatus Chisholmbacteria bacterium RIFCSPHIGHO2_01_FULL_52_32 TaxID=1797591 RepID=A0A1G1VTB4_9BACT|nr:MAG: hypothetical protein A2786_04070 [Candidatus Chisholmbacteria bacterium RIFCSPHIGHO2_01_FULL_52_32]OGY19981.1 MAG: hypothetical protein A2900_02675 [Candidatus Chisholmbacteria bacterium RIFCSPLOWO2_01_FULL_50_28]